MSKNITRDISYAQSAQTRRGRAVIRLLEGATGRGKVIRRAAGYEEDLAQGADIWQAMVTRFGVEVKVQGAHADIPKTGPVIFVANHPYGILDGLVMGHFLAQTRADFRILANSVFGQAPEIAQALLPISFAQTKDALRVNLDTRKQALAHLSAGGVVGVFPGGTVSTSAKPFSAAMDPGWRNFTAKLIQKSGARVVPLYFHGSNSRLFQIASHIHSTLRLGLLISEFRARISTPVEVTVGAPIPKQDLALYARNSTAMMGFLRQATYDLSPTPLNALDYGYEFEDKYRV